MNYLEINNRKMLKFNNKELLNMLIKQPNIQRIIDNKKIDEIIQYQLKHMNEHNGKSNFLGVINLHYYNENYYLMDGQHRFMALIKLYKEYSHIIDVFVEIVYVDSEIALNNNYSMINKNTPLPDLPVNVNKSVLEECMNYFKITYPNIWATGNNSMRKARRPFIKHNDFQESLGFIINKLNIDDHNVLIKLVEEVNNNHKDYKRNNISDRMYDTAVNNNMYLGLNICSNEEWGYKWAKEIVEFKTGNTIKKHKIKRKRKIPKVVKDTCWDKCVGNSIGEILCPICHINKINQNNFEAGHIISEKNGGPISIDNIIPICKKCNCSISSKNMDEFVLQHFPNYFDYYKSKKYVRIFEYTNDDKINVWNKYCKTKTCKCSICNKNNMTMSDFYIGYKISYINKGKNTLDNMRPICIDCNSDIGIQDIELYITTNYPNNMKRFLSDKYRKKHYILKK